MPAVSMGADGVPDHQSGLGFLSGDEVVELLRLARPQMARGTSEHLDDLVSALVNGGGCGRLAAPSAPALADDRAEIDGLLGAQRLNGILEQRSQRLRVFVDCGVGHGHRWR
jgi:hypothetical protein